MQVSSCPRLSGKVSAELTKGVSVSKNEKSGFYGMTLNTCLSFLNEVKNLAKDTRFKYSNLCTHARPYRLAGSALPSVFGGSERLRKKEIKVYHFIYAFFLIFLAGVFVDIRIPF